MFFVNLSFAEFLVLFTGISALVTTLYLLNRARRKQAVATLKFWVQAQAPIAARQRRKIQQPWSLLLQLLSLALLLLAIAQLRWGSPKLSSRDHVLILDTSSWMGAQSGNGTLLDEAKAAARSYVHALPGSDRVMLVRADGLATPVTGLETNRKKLDAAIADSRPGADALNLEQAISFATQIQRLHTQRMGEVVFSGGDRVLEEESGFQPPSDVSLRILPVSNITENCGLRKIGLRRSDKDPAVWDVFVAVRNYGTRARTVPVALQFGGAPAASRVLHLGPQKEEEVTFAFRTRAAGWLEARLLIDDALADDNRAVLELPGLKALKVAVYTSQPELLRPVLAANPQVEAVYRSPAEYDPKVNVQIVVFDGFRPAEMPNAGVICIQPPADGSPVKVRTTVTTVPVIRWRTDHALGNGLRTKELRLAQADVYSPATGDIPVAEVDAGPVILARPGPPRLVVMGFHPGKSEMRNELATPLLFANILGWLEPETFRRWELHAGSTGAVSVELENETEPARVSVISDRQQQLPFTLKGKSLRFFAGSPGVVRVITEGRERVYSLTLPEVGEALWKAPDAARRGIPTGVQEVISRDLWRWLAMLGGLGLLIEWLLFGRSEPGTAKLSRASAGRTWRKAS